LKQLRKVNGCDVAAPICFEYRNILATNQIARRTREPFENNNKRSQGRLGEGGPLSEQQHCIRLWDEHHWLEIKQKNSEISTSLAIFNQDGQFIQVERNFCSKTKDQGSMWLTGNLL